MAPQKEVKLPGLVSNGLLGVSRSMQSVCNRAATIYEMRSPTAFQTVGLHEEEREVMSERGFGQNACKYVNNDIRLGMDVDKVVSRAGFEKECGLEAGKIAACCTRGATLGQPGLSHSVVALEEVDGLWVTAPHQGLEVVEVTVTILSEGGELVGFGFAVPAKACELSTVMNAIVERDIQKGTCRKCGLLAH